MTSTEETTTKSERLGKRRRESLGPEEPGKDEALSEHPEADTDGSERSAAKRMRRDEDEGADSTTISTGSSSPVDSAGVAAPSPPADMPNTSGSSRKRAKLDPTSGFVPDEPPGVQTSPLLTIPPEIFSEIVLSTSSPADALALSLTCKALLASLSLPQSSFIWTALRRSVGQNFDWDVAQLSGGRLTPFSAKEKEEKLMEMYGMPDWQKIETEGKGWKGMLFRSEQEFLGFAYGIGVGAGSRKCETCGEEMPYGKSYVSYALRISLCDKRDCKRTFIATHLTKARHPLGSQFEGHQMHDKLRARLEPQLERELRGAAKETPIVGVNYVGAHFVYRTDVFKLEQLVNSALEMEKEERDEMLSREGIRMAAWAKLCDELALWRRKTKDYYFKNKRANEMSVYTLAATHQWNPEDLLNCTVYGPYHRHKNHTMYRVSDADIATLLPAVISQMAALIAKRTRGAQDAVYHTFRDQIISYHKHLVKLSPTYDPFPSLYASTPKTQGQRDIYAIVPALSAFRDLEVMRMLQTTHVELPSTNFSPAYHSWRDRKMDDSKSWRETVKKIVKQGDVGRSLRGDKVLGVIVRAQVGKWVQDAREGLVKVLAGSGPGERDETGVDEQATSAEGSADAGGVGSTVEVSVVQDPKAADSDLEHFITRFRCKKCQVYDGDYALDECLDFRGACMHECTINGVKGNRKAKWHVDNFEKDEKAVAILKKIEAAVQDKYPRSVRDNISCEMFLGILPTPYQTKSEARVWKTEVLCMSCEVPVLMTMKDAIGHSHRHEDMQIKPVWSRPTDACDDVGEILKAYREHNLVKSGTTKEMLGKSWKSKSGNAKSKEGSESATSSKRDKKGKTKAGSKTKKDTKGKGKETSVKEVTVEVKAGQAMATKDDKVNKEEERKFACRHCHNSHVLSAIRAGEAKQVVEPEAKSSIDPDNATAGGSGSSGTGGGAMPPPREEPATKTPAWMEWNGMRSHVKAKHGIFSIRDEDYFMKAEMFYAGSSWP